MGCAGDMISFDTDGLRPHERFDHWCEVRARELFGVTIEVPRERRPEFYGRFAACDAGGATLAEMQAASYKVSRSWADIHRLPSDSLVIARQIRGPGSLHTGGDRVQMISNGTLTINHSDLPFAGIPERTDGFHFLALKIPLAGNEQLAARARNLTAAPLAQEHWMTRLIDVTLAAIVARPHEVTDATIRHIAQLALLARGREAAGSPESRGALRHGHLQLALALVGRHLPRQDLSPALVAGMLNVSVRQLHLLFEPTGLSFSRTVLAMRLTEARRRIETMPLRPVTEIAQACGFDSAATFYRTFRQAYGMVPGDLRKTRPFA